MNEKEFVLVSQGIEIYRTKSQENAVNMVKKENDEYFDYLQKCYDNYERPADNYIDLEIEYAIEKEKDKEIERLKKEIETLKQPQVFIDTQDMEERYGEELYKEYLEKENKRLNNIINELEKWLEDYIKLFDEPDMLEEQTCEDLKEVLDKLQELKGSDKE